MKKEWGFEKLVSLDTFNDTSNGLLVDDCCAFGVDIIVMKFYDGKGEVLSFIQQPKNCTQYSYIFIKLSSVQTESDPFNMENYKWYA